MPAFCALRHKIHHRNVFCFVLFSPETSLIEEELWLLEEKQIEFVLKSHSETVFEVCVVVITLELNVLKWPVKSRRKWN